MKAGQIVSDSGRLAATIGFSKLSPSEEMESFALRRASKCLKMKDRGEVMEYVSAVYSIADLAISDLITLGQLSDMDVMNEMYDKLDSAMNMVIHRYHISEDEWDKLRLKPLQKRRKDFLSSMNANRRLVCLGG